MLFLVAIILVSNAFFGAFKNVLFLLLPIFLIGITVTVLLFVASNKMRDKKTCEKGALISLIVGIISSNIFAIIGGILGLVDSKK